MRRIVLLVVPLALLVTAVTAVDEGPSDPAPLVPLAEPFIPPDNPMSAEKVALGKMLFFDARLSGDAGTSCASCHDPRTGWGDGDELSRGYPGSMHWRNSETIINAAFLQKLFWGGEAKSLEVQAKSAITGNLAGNGDPMMIEERLAQCPEYVEKFKAVFGTEYPLFTDVLKAVAAYERTLYQNDTPYDRFLKGEQDALNDEAKRGFELFQGKAGCIQCHNGPLLTDENFHDLGVPDNEAFEYDPLRQIALRYQHYSRGVPEEEYVSARTDFGLYYTTKQDEDKGKFRTHSLRYLLYTPPYMHNGIFYTLEEVIEFYNEGGGTSESKSPLLKPLGLSDQEKDDLLEFLLSMSGEEIIHEPPLLPEYAVLTPNGLGGRDE
jgi:cytochrome c peroxidase